VHAQHPLHRRDDFTLRGIAVIVPPSRLPIISARIEKKSLFSRVTSQHRDDYGVIVVYATITPMIMIPFVRVSLRNNECSREVRCVRNPQGGESATRCERPRYIGILLLSAEAFASMGTLKDARMAEPTPEDFAKRETST